MITPKTTHPHSSASFCDIPLFITPPTKTSQTRSNLTNRERAVDCSSPRECTPAHTTTPYTDLSGSVKHKQSQLKKGSSLLASWEGGETRSGIPACLGEPPPAQGCPRKADRRIRRARARSLRLRSRTALRATKPDPRSATHIERPPRPRHLPRGQPAEALHTHNSASGRRQESCRVAS